MSRERREAFFFFFSSSCTVEGGEEEKAPLPLEAQAKMAALGAYPMSWERFYQLEHDGPWAREGSQESEQVESHVHGYLPRL